MRNLNNIWSNLRHLLISAIALAVLLCLLWVSSRVVVAQDADQCPCLTETSVTTETTTTPRNVAWQNESSSRVPRQLQTTAIEGGRGASEFVDEGLCKNVFVTRSDAEVWVVTPEDYLILNEPEHGGGRVLLPTIKVFPCGSLPDPSTQILLMSPNGELLNLEENIYETSETHQQIITYVYRFSSDSPSGTYTLQIQNRSGKYTKEFVLMDYMQGLFRGPTLDLFDPVTGEQRRDFAAGEALNAKYTNRVSGIAYSSDEDLTEVLEVGLYRAIPEQERVDFSKAHLIDSWLIQTNKDGNFSETLNLPADTSAGEYWLTVAAREATFEPVSQNLLDSSSQQFVYYVAFSVRPPEATTAIQPTLEQDRRLLVYMAGEIRKTDLYIAEADGSNSIRLTGPDDYDQAEPDWAPDGRHIVYQSNETGNYDIWAMDVEDKVVLPLTDSPDDEREPDWSPSGSQIIYRRGGDSNADGELWVMDVDGSNQHRLNNQQIFGRSPVWSPDGQQVAFMSERSGVWQIHTYNLGTGETAQLTTCRAFHCRFPNWSLDGKYIIFNSTLTVKDFTPSGIWRVSSDGRGEAEVLLKGDGLGRPVRSSSGQIFFNSENGLEVMNVDSSNRYAILNTDEGFAPDVSR